MPWSGPDKSQGILSKRSGSGLLSTGHLCGNVLGVLCQIFDFYGRLHNLMPKISKQSDLALFWATVRWCYGTTFVGLVSSVRHQRFWNDQSSNSLATRLAITSDVILAIRIIIEKEDNVISFNMLPCFQERKIGLLKKLGE